MNASETFRHLMGLQDERPCPVCGQPMQRVPGVRTYGVELYYACRAADCRYGQTRV